MKEKAIHEFEHVMKAIEHLHEGDARAFLKFIYGRLNIYETGDGKYRIEQLVEDISSYFKEETPRAVEMRKRKKKDA